MNNKKIAPKFTMSMMLKTVCLVAIVLCLVLPGAQLQATRGTFCTGPSGSTSGCDNELTNLYCIEGRCKCPDYLTMDYANLPSGMSTVWNADLKKCVALNGALCHTNAETTKKGIPCQAGVKCEVDPKAKNSPLNTLGKCTGTQAKLSVIAFLLCCLTKIL